MATDTSSVTSNTINEDPFNEDEVRWDFGAIKFARDFDETDMFLSTVLSTCSLWSNKGSFTLVCDFITGKKFAFFHLWEQNMLVEVLKWI